MEPRPRASTEPSTDAGTRELLRALSTAIRILSAERNETAALRESFEHAARGFGAHAALLLRVVSAEPLALDNIHHTGRLTPQQIEACVHGMSVPGVSPSVIRKTIAAGEPQLIPNSLDLEQQGDVSVSLSAAPHSVMAAAVADPWAHSVLAVLYFQTLVHERTYGPEDLQFLEAYATALSQAFGLFLSSERRYREMELAAEGAPEIIGGSPETTRLKVKLHEVYLPATRNARPDPILVLGPTGSGKDVVASYLHYYSPTRKKGPLVAYNCTGLSGDLCEKLLFGHVKGAFTDARADAPGLFRQAHGGTLFLDEVGELPPQGQAQLLRVLDSRKVRPVGGAFEFGVNVQIVLATNRDLEKAVSEGHFREDLYHRFKNLTIRLSPLSKRPGDLRPLMIHFFERHQRRLQKRNRGLTARASRALLSYSWPGNVRELDAVCSALTTHARDGDIIDIKLIQEECPQILTGPRLEAPPDDDTRISFREARDRWEHNWILQRLQLHGWSVAEAAKSMDRNKVTLYRYLKHHAIRPGRDEADAGGASDHLGEADEA